MLNAKKISLVIDNTILLFDIGSLYFNLPVLEVCAFESTIW